MMPDKNQQGESDLQARMQYLVGFRNMHGYFPIESLTELTDLLCMYIVDRHMEDGTYEREE